MRELFSEYGLELLSDQENMLEKYAGLLTEWNQKMNLTSITSHEDIVRKHFLDSALLLSASELSLADPDREIRLLDVGTGAGFPGLVLAILRPTWQITLLDSLNKRIDFLNTVITELDLKNVQAIHGRAEELGRDDTHRLHYDLVVSRAVADLRLLLEFCMPFVSDSGIFVSYKGPKFSSELTSALHALEELHTLCCFDREFSLGESERVLVGFRHDGSFPEKYPRRAGIPAKRPL